MAYLSTNGGHVITTTQLSAPGLLPTTPHVVQHLENHHVNQTTFITQNKSARHQMFKGKLMGLGITEIVTGTIIMIIGIILISIAVYRFNIRDFSVAIGTPWWTGVLFIIAGSLAVAVETNPSHSLLIKYDGSYLSHMAIKCCKMQGDTLPPLEPEYNCIYVDDEHNYFQYQIR
ncbi:hypothetical protein scyTo_0022116 [Scyliorhinus torazame]|uniref:Uncharacterized protein n=1 Tax=Scyliorhinus torazame TaxID=75743 RepID=A0A401Q6U5_SCYTO|nr:hypothetical protein [Scyliorhinus torazame]